MFSRKETSSNCTSSRLLKKAHLRRCRAWALAAAYAEYASLGPTRAALHLDLFEQPGEKRVFQQPATHIVWAEPGDSGIYCLVLWVPRACRIQLAHRPACDFPPGWYVYTGSAKRRLLSRLRRHVRRSKTVHWHVDRLRPFARISEIWVRPWAPGSECGTNARLRRLPGATIPCRGFGASDCRCDTHLFHLPYRPAPPNTGWRARLRARGTLLVAIG